MSNEKKDPGLGTGEERAESLSPETQVEPVAPGRASPDAGGVKPGGASADELRAKALAAPAAETWRTFAAVELPKPVRQAIAGLKDQMPGPVLPVVRWVHPDGVHITLKFLGDVAPQQTLEIARLLAEAASRSGRISLRTGAPGAFPAVRSPRVLWVNFKGETQRLVQLQGRVEGALGTLGFPPDRDRFSPHATAGRLNNEAQTLIVMRVGQAWELVKLPPDMPEFTVNSVVLFRSQLDPGGARYEKLFEAPLG